MHEIQGPLLICVFFWTLLLFQSPLNRKSGLQCPVGSEIPSGLGLVLASFSSLMIADEGREILTWSVPEKLLRKSEWFNIIVNKCTTPALRHKFNFCSNFKNSLPNLMNWASYFPPDGFRYWILQPRTCCQVISWHTYVPNWLSVRQNVNLSFMNLDGKKSKSSTKSTEGPVSRTTICNIWRRKNDPKGQIAKIWPKQQVVKSCQKQQCANMLSGTTICKKLSATTMTW